MGQDFQYREIPERPANAIAPMFAKAYPTIQAGANQKIGYRQLGGCS
jgi:hypothetical protein